SSAGELDAGLDCLRAGIAEERAREAVRSDRRDLGQQLGAGIVEEDLVTGGELTELVDERGGEAWMGMTERRDTVVAHGVEVAVALVVVEPHARAADECDIALCVERYMGSRVEMGDRFGGVRVYHACFLTCRSYGCTGGLHCVH